MNIEDKICSVEQEITFINHYIEVLQFRYQFLQPVVWKVDPAAEQLRIPRMLIYPIVENSVFHGLLPKRQGGISVEIQQSGGKIAIAVTDNGVGMRPEKLEALKAHIASEEPSKQKRSIGMQNVNRRLQINGGEEKILQIKSTEGIGTRVSFFIYAEPPQIPENGIEK